jgi:hypothetical protein
MPRQLTDKQIERQDEVDNAIFHLIEEISPVMTAWDMEVIGEVLFTGVGVRVEV